MTTTGATSRRSTSLTTGLAAGLVALLLALTACSGDSDEPGDGSGPDGSAATDAAVETDAALGAVKGRLKKSAEADVLTGVTAVVETWFAGAYGGEYPRVDFDAAFGDFTKGARALALKQPAIMSNAEAGADLEGVEITKKKVRVDVLAPNGKPAGATARFRLHLDLTGGVERSDLVVGRLLLTPVEGGWKVFGFDVRRGEEG